HDRVDDEGRGRIVSGDTETDRSRPLPHPLPSDLLSGAPDALVDHRLAEAQRGRAHVQDKIALRTQLDPLGALEPELDGSRVRPGGDDEVVLEPLLARAVVGEVDSGVDLAIEDPCIYAPVGPPLAWIAADQGMDAPGKLVEPLRDGGRIGAEHPHLQGCLA